jgi:hypothetical protein
MVPKFNFSQSVKEKCSTVDPSLIGQADEEDELDD